MLGELISAGASLLGGLFGNQQRAEGQNREIELQKEFAQNGVRWKVEDAARAGVHPLAALGATGASYSPVGLGENDTAASLSAAGQDFGRAIESTRTAPERMSAYNSKVEALTLDRMGLENTLLRAQILGATQPRNPPFPVAGSDTPMPGQGNSSEGTIEIGGVKFPRPPGWSPAQDIENELGEVGDWLYGIPASIARGYHRAASEFSWTPHKPGIVNPRQR